MDIAHLLISLGVKVTQLLTRGRAESLLKVSVQTAPSTRGLVGDLVALVEAARAVRRLDLAVEVGQRRGELG